MVLVLPKWVDKYYCIRVLAPLTTLPLPTDADLQGTTPKTEEHSPNKDVQDALTGPTEDAKTAVGSYLFPRTHYGLHHQR